MKLLKLLPFIALVGCTATGDYLGPKRGFDGSIDTLTVDIEGHSTTFNKESELPLGYLRSGDQEAYPTYSSGEVNATGLAATIAACEADPECIKAALN